MDYRELFYISNILSLLRMLLVIPIYHLMIQDTPAASYWAVVIMIIAALTDSFDGRLARRLNQQSDLGRILDPVADKVAIGVMAFLLVQLRDLPLWFLGLVIFRDLAIVLMGVLVMQRRKIVVESVMLGKITATSLAALIIIYTLNISILKQPLLWLNVALIVASSVVYFRRFNYFLQGRELR